MNCLVHSNHTGKIGWMYWTAWLMVQIPVVCLFGNHFYILELGPLVGAVYLPAETRSGFEWPFMLSFSLFTASIFGKQEWGSLWCFIAGLTMWYGSGLFYIASCG